MNRPSKPVVSLRLRKPLKLARIPKGADSPVEVLIWKCCAYASWGKSSRVIRSQLGISNYHIAKILRAHGIKRKHYRDNMRIDPDVSKRYPTPGGLIALEVDDRIEMWAERKLIDNLEKQMLR